MRDTGVSNGVVSGKAAPGGDKRAPTKSIGHDPAKTGVIPATAPPDKAPPSNAPSGDGVVESGGGSFDQK